MKYIFTLLLLLYYTNSFSQWTRVQELPSSDISSLYFKGSTLYAGGKSIIYFSKNKGQTWDSTNRIPQFSAVDNIIIYKNELYAASYAFGVYKSGDKGITWKKINTGLFPFVSDFTIWKGNLYAATLGSSVFKLEPFNRNNWSSFSNGLSSLSANLTSIASAGNTLIAGTLANGLYDYLPAKSTVWEERFLVGQLKPSEGVYDIAAANDTLYLTGRTGLFYRSINNGSTWNIFGNSLPSTFTSLANAKQALLLARNSFNGVNNTSFYYIKKDSLRGLFKLINSVADHFTYKLEIFGDEIWDASTKGLFFMPVSALPSISAEDAASPLTAPVQFTLANAKCEASKVAVAWQTVQQSNTDYYNVERSADGINWTVIGNDNGAENDKSGSGYSFTDYKPEQNSLYRIAVYDQDKHAQYSTVLSPSCTVNDVISLWPNPVNDIAFIGITAANGSQAVIKIYNSKGILVKAQSATILQGGNKLCIDVRSLEKGLHYLSADWDNGQIQRTLQIWKQ